ncbi:hypothetical protein [Mycobacterium sp.]|jgi:hypothetical protein|uniref:hypothetical protein n=1 Tax=Mycobacterium sp. TaxID=1785 RepID=UPI0025FE0E9A|nr:hypothetical protein [Mycobacterium sp.]
MRIPPAVAAAAVITATLVGVSACGNDSQSAKPESSSSTTPRPVITDYTTLLIKAGDIKAPDAFTAGPATKNPNGEQGATVTFTDQDHSHAIVDTIHVLPDIQAAAGALESAKATHRETLLAKSLNAEVGVSGATISGLSPDHSKGVTVLVFTRDRVLVTLEFDGPSFALAPQEFITQVGQKQDEAVKAAFGG